MMADINPSVDVDPDGPGDLFVPYSLLRLRNVAAELRITPKLYKSVIRTDEDPKLDRYERASAWIGACVWGIEELERELVALRRELRGVPES